METKTSSVVADSSALFALADRNDPTHQMAIKVSASFTEETTILVAPEVFSETINTLWKKLSKEIALITAKDILNSNKLVVTEILPEIRLSALEKFAKIRSKKISFTDCLVMAFADAFKTKFIFGFDEGFKKNGYFRLGLDT